MGAEVTFAGEGGRVFLRLPTQPRSPFVFRTNPAVFALRDGVIAANAALEALPGASQAFIQP